MSDRRNYLASKERKRAKQAARRAEHTDKYADQCMDTRLAQLAAHFNVEVRRG